MHESGDGQQNNRGNDSKDLSKDRRAEENLEFYRQIDDAPRPNVWALAVRWLQLAAGLHAGVFTVASTQIMLTIMALAKVEPVLPYWLVASLGLSGMMFEIFRARHEASRPSRKGSDSPGGARPRT